MSSVSELTACYSHYCELFDLWQGGTQNIEDLHLASMRLRVLTQTEQASDFQLDLREIDSAQDPQRIRLLKTRIDCSFRKMVQAREQNSQTILSLDFLQPLKMRLQALLQHPDGTNASDRINSIIKSLDDKLQSSLPQEQKANVARFKSCLQSAQENPPEALNAALTELVQNVEQLEAEICAQLSVVPEERELSILKKPQVHEVYSSVIINAETKKLREKFPNACKQLLDLLTSDFSNDFVEPLLNKNYFLLIQCIDLIRRDISVFSSELFIDETITRDGNYKNKTYREFIDEVLLILKNASNERILDLHVLSGEQNCIFMEFISRAYNRLADSDFKLFQGPIRCIVNPTDRDLAALAFALADGAFDEDAKKVLLLIASPTEQRTCAKLVELFCRLKGESDFERCSKIVEEYPELNDGHLEPVYRRIANFDIAKALHLAGAKKRFLKSILESQTEQFPKLIEEGKRLSDPARKKFLSLLGVYSLFKLQFEQATKCLEEKSKVKQVSLCLRALNSLVKSNSDHAVLLMQFIQKHYPITGTDLYIHEMSSIVIMASQTAAQNGFLIADCIENEEFRYTLYGQIIQNILQNNPQEKPLAKRYLLQAETEYAQNIVMSAFFGYMSPQQMSMQELVAIINELPDDRKARAQAHLCFRIAQENGIQAAIVHANRYCHEPSIAKLSYDNIALLFISSSRVNKDDFKLFLDGLKQLDRTFALHILDKAFNRFFLHEEPTPAKVLAYAILSENYGFGERLEFVCKEGMGNEEFRDELSSTESLPAAEPPVQALFEKARNFQLPLDQILYLRYHPEMLKSIATGSTGMVLETGSPPVSVEFGLQLAFRISEFLKMDEIKQIADFQEIILNYSIDRLGKVEPAGDLLSAVAAFLMQETDEYAKFFESTLSSPELKDAFKAFKPFKVDNETVNEFIKVEVRRWHFICNSVLNENKLSDSLIHLQDILGQLSEMTYSQPSFL